METQTTPADKIKAAGGEPAVSDAYVNADDLFYWMEDEQGADIPLCALSIEMPTGCRFCI